MKFSFSSTILIFCAFQVHFIFSNEMTYVEKMDKLMNLRTIVKTKNENMTAFLQREYNNTYKELHGLAKLLTDRLIYLALGENSKLQSVKATVNCKDTRWCRNNAYRAVLELIDNDNKTLKRIVDKNIEKIINNSQITNLNKTGTEILLELNSEFDNESNSNCLKNHTFYENADDCLSDKIKKTEFFLESFKVNENIFELETNFYLRKRINETYWKINNKHIILLNELGKLKTTFSDCTNECILF